MALARILTLRPEEATGLSEQLQQLGFDVEITSPHERNLATADLEIEFAICDQQQVLGRASAIAAQLQADVVVFPHALPPLPRRIVVEEAPAPIPEPVEKQAPNQPVEIPVEQEPEPVLPLVMEDSGEQLPRIAWSARFAAGLRTSGRQVASAAGVVAGKLRSGFVRLKPKLAGAALKFKSTTSAAGNAVADRTREYQERMKLRAAQAQVNRARRLAEMERLRAEAREQVAALERARMAAEAQHQQLQSLDQQREVKPARPRLLQLRGVFAGAAAAAALFLVGMLLANFHATPPISHSITESSIEQQLPFGAATVHGPPGFTIAAKPAKPLPAAAKAPQPTSKPQPAHHVQAKQPKSQWHHFSKNSSRDQEGTADDVVVRHFGQPRKPGTQTAQQRQPQVKRYSDQ